MGNYVEVVYAGWDICLQPFFPRLKVGEFACVHINRYEHLRDVGLWLSDQLLGFLTANLMKYHTRVIEVGFVYGCCRHIVSDGIGY